MNIITLTLAINLEETAKVCVRHLVNILQINLFQVHNFHIGVIVWQGMGWEAKCLICPSD